MKSNRSPRQAAISTGCRKLNSRKTLLRGLDRFDGAVLASALALLVAIGMVVVNGDQVGLRVARFGPSEVVSSRASLLVIFDEPIVPASVETHVVIEPPVSGRLSAVGERLIFIPAEFLRPGQVYTMTIRAGLEATNGRALRQDIRWQFHVRLPRVVFLGPMDSMIQNLYVVDPAAPAEPQKLVDSEDSILGYDVSLDGSKIVYSAIIYSEATSSQSTALFVYDTASGKSMPLYECKDAACTNLTWRPDGGAIAFQRVDFNSTLGLEPGAPRVWIFDVAANSAQPLFGDNQQLGYMPRWSPDGSRLAVFSVSAGGILIHDFASGKHSLIAAVHGEVGHFSPDGKKIFFPKIVALPGGDYAMHLTLVDLSSEPYTQRDLEAAEEPVSDVEAIWRADSKGLIVARQPATRTIREGPQLYDVDIVTGRATLLVPHHGYDQKKLSLSPTGDAIVFQRIALDDSVARPELWMYNRASHELKRLAQNGTLPRWIP